jgi:methionine--tRNA ligase beta chain
MKQFQIAGKGLFKRCYSSSKPCLEFRFRNYEGHVPTRPSERLVLAASSAVGAFLDPTRADLIATLGETTGEASLGKLRDRMRDHPVGNTILTERPRVNTASVCVEELLGLKKNTFGYSYGKFLDGHGFNPDDRPAVQYVDDEELAYVITRYREIHDFAHVICGLPPTVFGEVALKWFEMAQTKVPMTALSAFVGPLRPDLSAEERSLLRKYMVWACKAGPTSELFLNVYFEKYYEEPLHELQKQVFGQSNFAEMPRASSGKKKKPAAQKKKKPKQRSTPKDGGALNPEGSNAFSKIDIRVGHIVDAWNHPDSEKLFCELIDVGEESPRSVASGLRSYYNLDDMIDRKVLVVCNLKPAKLAGFKSEGMVLCAQDGDKVEFVEPPPSAVIGERIIVDGMSGEPEANPNRVKKKKMWEAVAKDLVTNSEKVVCWDGAPLVTPSGDLCTCPTISNSVVS